MLFEHLLLFLDDEWFFSCRGKIGSKKSEGNNFGLIFWGKKLNNNKNNYNISLTFFWLANYILVYLLFLNLQIKDLIDM